MAYLEKDIQILEEESTEDNTIFNPNWSIGNTLGQKNYILHFDILDYLPFAQRPGAV